MQPNTRVSNPSDLTGSGLQLPEIRPPSQLAPGIADMGQKSKDLYQQKRYSEAFTAADKACSGGDSEGCGILATLYYFGQGVAQDKVRGQALALKSCEAGNGEVCNGIGVVNYQGGPPNLERAVEFFTKSCNLGYAQGCFDLAHCYQLGKGVDQSSAKAQELFQKSCSLGFTRGCVESRKVH